MRDRLLLTAIITCALGVSACVVTPLDAQDAAQDLSSSPQDLGPDLPDLATSPDLGSPQTCAPGLTLCAGRCVSLEQDPLHCGLCGRTCVLPNAQAACVASECAVKQCEPGFFDTDKDFTNGCEAKNQCVEATPCRTSCGSAGSTLCDQGQARCAAPIESCNAVDDDCEGRCDEGAIPGCRVGIHRGHPSSGGHIFTDDLSQIANVESQSYFHLYQQEPQGESGGGFKPVFLCNKANNRKLLTSDLECERAGGVIKQLGFWASQPVCNAIPLFRVYSEAAENHFYTISGAERDNAINNLGYRDEGIAGYVWQSL